MKNFICKENKIIREVKLKKDEIKNMLLELKSTYKYKDKFIETNFNASFAVLILENFLVVSEYVLKNYNVNFGIATSVKYKEDEETFILYVEIDRFYDVDFNGKTKEELEEILNNLSEVEKDVFDDYLEKIFDQEDTLIKITTFCTNTNNMDESIKKHKEENKEIKKSLLDFAILKGLFDIFALNVLKDSAISQYLY